MTRRARIEERNYFYHVICRGQRKNPLFFSAADMKSYFKFFNKYAQEHDFELYAYCLMRNHVHLLIRRREMSLDLFMRRLNTAYALYFNGKYDLTGHVFQGRYRSLIVYDDNYLRHLIKYMHMNPVSAGICKNPGKYGYSSASFYEGNEDNNVQKMYKISVFRVKTVYMKFLNSEEITFPVYKETVGDKKRYLENQKRKKGREGGTYKERRDIVSRKQSILNETRKFLDHYKITLNYFKANLKSSEMKMVKMNLIDHLLKCGHYRAGIACALGCSRSWISKIYQRKKK